jgi:hypothetical protein
LNIDLFVFANKRTHAHAHTHTPTHTHTHTRTHARTHAHTHTCIHTQYSGGASDFFVETPIQGFKKERQNQHLRHMHAHVQGDLQHTPPYIDAAKDAQDRHVHHVHVHADAQAHVDDAPEQSLNRRPYDMNLHADLNSKPAHMEAGPSTQEGNARDTHVGDSVHADVRARSGANHPPDQHKFHSNEFGANHPRDQRVLHSNQLPVEKAQLLGQHIDHASWSGHHVKEKTRIGVYC